MQLAIQAQVKIGIQGGAGSFNHQALQLGIQRRRLSNVDVDFLFTTDAVLSALQEGRLDYGQFALYNSLGGPVSETLDAIGCYQFEVVESYGITIEHSLICKKGVQLEQIKTIISHPHAIKQCENTLRYHASRFVIKSGEGEMIDPARVAQALRDNELPDDHATLSSHLIADVYDLDLVARGWQDKSDNVTTFLLVKQRS